MDIEYRDIIISRFFLSIYADDKLVEDGLHAQLHSDGVEFELWENDSYTRVKFPNEAMLLLADWINFHVKENV